MKKILFCGVLCLLAVVALFVLWNYFGVVTYQSECYFPAPSSAAERTSRLGHVPPDLEKSGALEGPALVSIETEPGRTLESGVSTPIRPSVGTVIEVSALTVDGIPITDGALTCYWGPGIQSEISANGRQEHRRISTLTTSVVVPLAARNALIEIRTTTGAWGRQRVYELRRDAERIWIPDDVLAYRSVEVVVSALDSPGMTWGNVFVDGELRVPAGLRVILEQDAVGKAATMAEHLASRPQLAIVDVDRARYGFPPIQGKATAVFAMSVETQPLWMKIGTDLSIGKQLDIHLKSGKELIFQFVAEGSHEPQVGLPIEVALMFPVEVTSRMQFNRVHVARYTTNAQGGIHLRGLVDKARIEISLILEGDNATLFPYSDRVQDLLERESPIVIEMLAEQVTPGVLWGHATSWTTTMLAFRPVGGGAISRESLPTVGDWEVSIPPGFYDTWLISASSDRRLLRVTGVQSIEINAGQRVGPISFDPLHSNGWPLDWSGKQVQARLTITARDAFGEVIRADGTKTAESSGQLWIPSDFVGQINFDLNYDKAGEIRRALGVFERSTKSLMVDLGEDRSQWIEVLSPNLTLLEYGSLFLYRLSDDSLTGSVQAMLHLSEGRVPEQVALPLGTYFYRVHSTEKAFICGLVEVSNTVRDVDVSLDWHGTLSYFPLAATLGVTTYEVVTIGDTHLTGIIPATLRRFELPAADSTGLSKIWIDQESCSWERVDNN